MNTKNLLNVVEKRFFELLNIHKDEENDTFIYWNRDTERPSFSWVNHSGDDQIVSRAEAGAIMQKAAKKSLESHDHIIIYTCRDNAETMIDDPEVPEETLELWADDMDKADRIPKVYVSYD